MKLFNFGVTGISPLDVEALRSDSARGVCRGELIEGSSEVLKQIVVSGIDDSLDDHLDALLDGVRK